MDVSQLLIGDAVVEREVEMVDGSKAVMHFRELPNTAFERHAIWSSSKDEAVQASAAARLVSMALCEPDGKPALTVEQAERIKRPLLVRLLNVVFEVNGMIKPKKAEAGNASAPETPNGSGTS
jgi:hypothetical protein